MPPRPLRRPRRAARTHLRPVAEVMIAAVAPKVAGSPAPVAVTTPVAGRRVPRINPRVKGGNRRSSPLLDFFGPGRILGRAFRAGVAKVDYPGSSGGLRPAATAGGSM